MEIKPGNERDEAKVKCEVCLKEIPRSEAKSAEAIDYVVYFCGLDCYEKWGKNNRSDELAGGGD